MALTDKLTAIGEAIRGKTGKTEKLTLEQMPHEIASIVSGGGGGEDLSVVIKAIVDARGSAQYLIYCAHGNDVVSNELIQKAIVYKTFENATDMQRAFQNCQGIVNFPSTNTKKCTTFYDTFRFCSKLETVGELDIGSATNVTRIFGECSALKDVDIRNIKVSISFSDSPKLTKECVLKILYELDETSSTQTLTVHSTVKAMIDGLKVRKDGDKLVEDSAGVSASEYARLKNWNIEG